ncbi:MAG: hypothetical protein RDV48_14490 [Candidatus Eremiobacteraeota bacterium]|nr:hypothetical protein [Candidatus Eremiobacteraeota bacterium]
MIRNTLVLLCLVIFPLFLGGCGDMLHQNEIRQLEITLAEKKIEYEKMKDKVKLLPGVVMKKKKLTDEREALEKEKALLLKKLAERKGGQP